MNEYGVGIDLFLKYQSGICLKWLRNARIPPGNSTCDLCGTRLEWAEVHRMV